LIVLVLLLVLVVGFFPSSKIADREFEDEDDDDGRGRGRSLRPERVGRGLVAPAWYAP
jgi:hypothetical protein